MSFEDDTRHEGVDLAALMAAVGKTGEEGVKFNFETVEADVVAMIEEMKFRLQPADPNVVPCKIPTFPSQIDFYLFCIKVSKDDWLKEHALIVSFQNLTGGRLIAFILKKDKDFFNSPEGRQHLKSSNLYFYTIEEYVKAVSDNLERERGIHE